MDSLVRVPGKVLTWSKIISNERNLRRYDKKADSIIKVKDSIIRSLILKEKMYIKEMKSFIIEQKAFIKSIDALNRRNSEANNKIYELSNTRLKIEKLKKPYGIYLSIDIGTGFSYTYIDRDYYYKNGFLGIEYIGSNIIIGAKVNPLNKNYVYLATMGLKIF